MIYYGDPLHNNQQKFGRNIFLHEDSHTVASVSVTARGRGHAVNIGPGAPPGTQDTGGNKLTLWPYSSLKYVASSHVLLSAK